MGLIVDERDLWWCRDCGARIVDAETRHRLDHLLRERLPIPKLEDDGGMSIELTSPGVCPACGGGRVAFGTGKIG